MVFGLGFHLTRLLRPFVPTSAGCRSALGSGGADRCLDNSITVHKTCPGATGASYPTVASIQMRIAAVRDKELAGACISACQCYPDVHRAEGLRRRLTRHRWPQGIATVAVGTRRTELGHKSGHNTMHDVAIVKATTNQVDEARHRDGRGVGVEFQLQLTGIGRECHAHFAVQSVFELYGCGETCSRTVADSLFSSRRDKALAACVRMLT